MIRILIADDHAIVREGLKQIVAENPDMSVTGEATTGDQVLDKVREGGWNVLVLDITMPGKSGLDVLLDVKHESPQLPVLVLSMHPEEQFALRALRAGAAGYLTKESAPEELVQAIKKVVGGGKYISATLAEKLAFEQVPHSDRPMHDHLSDREFQVLCRISAGQSLSKIGDALNLSVKTVSTYRKRVLEKMNMKTNSELTRYALKNQLVD